MARPKTGKPPKKNLNLPLNEEADFYTLDIPTRRLCTYAVLRDDKAKALLAEYYESLGEREQERFNERAEQFYDLCRRGARKYQTSKNAIALAIRINRELGIPCYPVIERVATKGWSAADGTFCWAMTRLDYGLGSLVHELYGIDPVAMCLQKKRKLAVDPLNGFMVVSAES